MDNHSEGPYGSIETVSTLDDFLGSLTSQATDMKSELDKEENWVPVTPVTFPQRSLSKDYEVPDDQFKDWQKMKFIRKCSTIRRDEVRKLLEDCYEEIGVSIPVTLSNYHSPVMQFVLVGTNLSVFIYPTEYGIPVIDFVSKKDTADLPDVENINTVPYVFRRRFYQEYSK